MSQLPNTLGKFVWHYLKPHKWCMAGFVVVASIWSEDASVLSGMVNDCFTNVMSVKLFHAIFGENKNLEKDVTQLIKSDRALQWYNFKLYLIQNLANTLLSMLLILQFS